MYVNIIGSRMAESRKAHGMTQRTLAKKSNLSMSCISAIENGYRRATNATVISIADALGVSPAYLIDKKGNKRVCKTSRQVMELILSLNETDNHPDIMVNKHTGHVFVSINDPKHKEFLTAYNKMSGLTEQNVISQGEFDSWLEGALQSLDGDSK